MIKLMLWRKLRPKTTKNLGTGFDSAMSLVFHINSICKSEYFHLRNISRIRKCLTMEARKSLVYSLITSRLDYCNALLGGVPQCHLKKLQALQNCAARLVTGTRKFDHITPILYHLHWLPVCQRIKFKLILITFKVFVRKAPQYIGDLLNLEVKRTTRSSMKGLINEPKVKCVTFGGRSFSALAPKWWNQLPLEIRNVNSLDSFKAQLKSYLSKEYFT